MNTQRFAILLFAAAGLAFGQTKGTIAVSAVDVNGYPISEDVPVAGDNFWIGYPNITHWNTLSIQASFNVLASPPTSGNLTVLYGLSEGASDVATQSYFYQGNRTIYADPIYPPRCSTVYMRAYYVQADGVTGDQADWMYRTACDSGIGFIPSPTETVMLTGPGAVNIKIWQYPGNGTHTGDNIRICMGSNGQGVGAILTGPPIADSCGNITVPGLVNGLPNYGPQTITTVTYDGQGNGTGIPWRWGTNMGMKDDGSYGGWVQYYQFGAGSYPGQIVTFAVTSPAPGSGVPTSGGSFDCTSTSAPARVVFRRKKDGDSRNCDPFHVSICDPIPGLPDTTYYPAYNNGQSAWTVRTPRLPSCSKISLTLGSYDGSASQEFMFKTSCAKISTVKSQQPSLIFGGGDGSGDDLYPFPTWDGKASNFAGEINDGLLGWDLAFQAAAVTASSQSPDTVPGSVIMGDNSGDLANGGKAWISSGQSDLDKLGNSYIDIDLSSYGQQPLLSGIVIWPFTNTRCWTPTVCDYLYLTDYWVFVSNTPFPTDASHGTIDWILAHHPLSAANHRFWTAGPPPTVANLSGPWDAIDLAPASLGFIAGTYVRIQRSASMVGTQLALGNVNVIGIVGDFPQGTPPATVIATGAPTPDVKSRTAPKDWQPDSLQNWHDFKSGLSPQRNMDKIFENPKYKKALKERSEDVKGAKPTLK